MKVICRFRGKYKFLSNFSESPFEFEGITYETVEHAYQERKTLDASRRKIIREASSAFEAATLGRSKDTIVQEGWLDGKKGEVMFELVRAKFTQNPELAKKLLQTEDAILIEGNYWHDNYFGMCNCKNCHEGEQPQNILGEILILVRAILRQKNRSEKLNLRKPVSQLP